jgi:hypothetical protein
MELDPLTLRDSAEVSEFVGTLLEYRDNYFPVSDPTSSLLLGLMMMMNPPRSWRGLPRS